MFVCVEGSECVSVYECVVCVEGMQHSSLGVSMSMSMSMSMSVSVSVSVSMRMSMRPSATEAP